MLEAVCTLHYNKVEHEKEESKTLVKQQRMMSKCNTTNTTNTSDTSDTFGEEFEYEVDDEIPVKAPKRLLRKVKH